jgi:hypothetical protein
MGFSQRLGAILAAAALLLAAAPAAADDSARNKEGFWTVGRGDAEAKGCMASIMAKDDTMLLIQVAPGHVDFVVGAKKKMRPGKKGVLTIGADSFAFEPDYLNDRTMMFFEDVNGRGLAAIRQAHGVTVQVDGRQLLDVSVENTGLAGALDAVIACSNGKSGWWGPGVGAERIADGPVPDKAADGPVLNKEGVWGLAVSKEPGICVAQAAVGDHRHLQILAAGGRMGLAVGSDGEDLPRGRKGRVETDAYAFDFKPTYGADSFVAADQPFDSRALSALARAKWIRVTVDGRELVDISLEGTGFAELLTSVAACSRGEKGWWGEGPPAAR